MDIKPIIKHQYHAALTMLKMAIEQCPESAWNDPEYKNAFWHIVYHTLFYTHLYLQVSEEEFKPWSKHREEYPFMGGLPWPPHRPPKIGEPYTKEEMLEYCEFCQKEVEEKVPILDMEGESGFWWYSIGKLEFQFNNIRHIQHHAAQLIDRLRTKNDIGTDWIPSVSRDS